MSKSTYQTFSDFYPFYLSQHRNRTCRRLHFLGECLALICLLLLFVTGNWWFLPLGLVLGYLFAWVGHFIFEHNRPATFSYPLYSFMGDWVMFKDILIGKITL